MRSLALAAPTLVLLASCAVTGPAPARFSVEPVSAAPAITEPVAAPVTPVTEPAIPAPAPTLEDSRGQWDFDFKRATVGIEAFYEDFELDEIEFEPEGAPDFDVNDIERTRAGIRGSYGWHELRIHAQIFMEEWDPKSAFSGTEFDHFGFGGGVMGAPAVYGEADSLTLVVPFRLTANLVAGSEDVGADDVDHAYVETEAEAGIGVDWEGLQPSAGFYLSAISGTAENDTLNTETDFSGSNAGPFVQVAYTPKDFPLQGKARYVFGNVEGFLLSLGVSF